MCMHESHIIFMMAFSKIITGGNQHKQAMLNPSNKTREIGSIINNRSSESFLRYRKTGIDASTAHLWTHQQAQITNLANTNHIGEKRHEVAVIRGRGGTGGRDRPPRRRAPWRRGCDGSEACQMWRTPWQRPCGTKRAPTAAEGRRRPRSCRPRTSPRHRRTVVGEDRRRLRETGL
jgi:hypothetical protein